MTETVFLNACTEHPPLPTLPDQRGVSRCQASRSQPAHRSTTALAERAVRRAGDVTVLNGDDVGGLLIIEWQH